LKEPSIQVGRRLDDQFLEEEDPPMVAQSEDIEGNPSFASPTFECFFNSPRQPVFPLFRDGEGEEHCVVLGQGEARADLGLSKATVVGPGPQASELEGQDEEHINLVEVGANQSDDEFGY
jgi:hypothetical protein